MGVSLFLAKLIGLYFLVAALVAVVRKEQFQVGVKNWVSSQGLMLFSGLFNIALGLAIVIGHPVWEMSWRVVISLLGVIAIIQGILRAGFWEEMQRWYAQIRSERAYWIVVAVLVIVGVFLTYHGFGI